MMLSFLIDVYYFIGESQEEQVSKTFAIATLYLGYAGVQHSVWKSHKLKSDWKNKLFGTNVWLKRDMKSR